MSQIKELISSDYQSVTPYQHLKIHTLKNLFQHEIYSLKEPVIINLNTVEFGAVNTPVLNKKQDENSRLTLTEEELNYFKDNGNNVTIFIHGFNVPYGKFGRYVKEVKYLKKHKTSSSTGYSTSFLNGYVCELSSTQCTIKNSFDTTDFDEKKFP